MHMMRSCVNTAWGSSSIVITLDMVLVENTITEMDLSDYEQHSKQYTFHMKYYLLKKKYYIIELL